MIIIIRVYDYKDFFLTVALLLQDHSRCEKLLSDHCGRSFATKLQIWWLLYLSSKLWRYPMFLYRCFPTVTRTTVKRGIKFECWIENPSLAHKQEKELKNLIFSPPNYKIKANPEQSSQTNWPMRLEVSFSGISFTGIPNSYGSSI